MMEIKERIDKRPINQNTVNPIPWMSSNTREHSGPTKAEEEFYFGDDDKKNKGDE